MKYDKNKQINVYMPQLWVDKLYDIARKESVKQNKTISHLDLVRETLNKHFNLDDNQKP